MRKKGFLVFILFTLAAIAGLATLTPGEPKYLEKGVINKTMIAWNKALGVKCSYCHTSDRSETYKSLVGKTVDEKELNALVKKRIAQGMLGMMLYYNKKENANYTCNTCHQDKDEVELE